MKFKSFFLFSLILCLGLVLGSVSFCFADSIPSGVTLYDFVYSQLNSITFDSTPLLVNTLYTPSGNGNSFILESTSPYSNGYLKVLNSNNGIVNSIYLGSLNLNSNGQYFLGTRSDNLGACIVYLTSSNKYDYEFFTASQSTWVSLFGENFSLSSPLNYSSFSGSFNRGNALVIDLGVSNWTIPELTLSYDTNGTFLSPSGNWSSGTVWGFVSDYTNLSSLSLSHSINWIKDNANVLGQATKGHFSFNSIIPTNRYLVIINPTTYLVSDNNGVYRYYSPSPISFNLDSSFNGDFGLVPLYQVNNDSNISNSTSGSSISSGTVDSSSGAITWGTDDNISGGLNSNQPSITDDSSSLSSLLSNFFNRLKDIVSIPIESITNLVSLSSNFVSSLGSLFSWLPSQVQTLLISALTVIICVGVFKVFL